MSDPVNRESPKLISLMVMTVLLIAAISSFPVLAGGNSQGMWAMQYGSGSTRSNGDYVSCSTAMNTAYQYWLEVPSGISQLRIEIFDMDTGGSNDFQLTGSWNTSSRYRVYDPSGTLQQTLTVGNDTAYDNIWSGWTFPNPAAGHWRVEVNTSSAITNGDDVNAYGIRAYEAETLAYLWDLSTNPGWTEDSAWAFGTPSGGGGQYGGPDPTSGHTGSNVFGYNLSGDYPNNLSPARNLTTTAINCSSLTNTKVRFWRWLGVERNTFDHALFQVSNNGITWNTIWQNPDTNLYDGGWVQVSYDIAGYADNQPTVYLRWVMGTTDSSWQYCGWNIDDVEIWAYNTSQLKKEINLYADSFIPFGVFSTNGSSTIYHAYPFVTGGCSFSSSDFDSDNSATYTFQSRTGFFSYSIPTPSGNDTWGNSSVSGWTADALEREYGIWHLTATVIQPNATGNQVAYYMRAFNAAAPPPTVNPQTNSVRMYFPTDAGNAPVKPIVTQQLSYVSGANPPVAGSTTRVRVDITVFNPTASAITFSGTNLVTANIPGSGAVYRGNATPSQGSVVSQPADGGTGNITWNPGAIAAGGDASLYYYVDATPTTAVTRVPITGTPATNGTTARYVDETGNTTQTRATYTYGPLCELAINAGTPVPTAAVVCSFTAAEEQGRVVVRWTTAVESRTAGFYVERYDASRKTWDTLNPRIFVALPAAPAGAAYGFVDETAAAGRSYYYALTEVETTGRYRRHGPYAVTVGSAGLAKDILAPWRDVCQRLPYPGTVAPEEKAAAAPALSAKTPTAASLKISIPEEGLYQLTTAQIAAGLGLSETTVRQRIRDRRLRLSTGPNSVAYRPLAGGAGLVFFGQGPSSPYATGTLYWLSAGEGLAMAEDAAVGIPPEGEPETFPASLHVEEDRWALTGLFTNPDEDFWGWDFFIADDPDYGDRQFIVDIPSVAAEGSASLTVRLIGESDTSHQVAVALNGSYLGEIDWVGPYTHEARLPFDATLLQPGLNTVELAALLGPGVEYSILYIDSFDLAYPQPCLAVDNELLLRGNSRPVMTVEGFSSDDIGTFDVTNPRRPKAVLSSSIRPDGFGGYAVSFGSNGPDSRYLVLTPERWRTPQAIEPVGKSEIRNANLPADYVVITPGELAAEAQRLAAYRSAQGLRTRVVRLTDIYNEFAYGYADPKAIRDFLAWAWGNWRVKPRYVVLAGAGTYDPLNHEGYGGNLLPAMLAGTSDGLFASDSRYGDVSGNDGVPEIAVGRLPARTEAELRAMVDKIITFEAQPPADWSRQVLLLADDPDVGGDFTAASETIAGLLPAGWAREKIYLENLQAGDAREMLLDELATGAGLLNYFGHAGMNQFAEESLLASEDVAGLGNGIRLPLVLAMTCVAGRFEIPGFDCLATTLVRQPDGGAVAVWAPTGFSVNGQALELDRGVIRAYAGGERVVGELILRAGRDLAGNAPSSRLLVIYTLFGDPATRLK